MLLTDEGQGILGQRSKMWFTSTVQYTTNNTAEKRRLVVRKTVGMTEIHTHTRDLASFYCCEIYLYLSIR